jgi:preprotein translocase subunit SecD
MVNPRNNFIILGLVLVLIGAAAYFIFIRQPVAEATRLGLDLEGGVTANLQGYKTDGSAVTQQEMDVAAGVIRQRVDSLGVTEPEIQLQGQDQVVVNIPGITDSDRAVEVIGRTAQLGFYEVLASAGGQPVPEGEIDDTKEELQAELEGDPAYEEGETQILFEESPSPKESGTVVAGYVLPKEPGLTGEALSSATVAREQLGRREVQMEFS